MDLMAALIYRLTCSDWTLLSSLAINFDLSCAHWILHTAALAMVSTQGLFTWPGLVERTIHAVIDLGVINAKGGIY